MNEQIAVFPYNGTLLSNKKKWMNYWYMQQPGESQKHHAEWKKPDVEDCTLCDSMDMNM